MDLTESIINYDNNLYLEVYIHYSIPAVFIHLEQKVISSDAS